MMGVSEAPELYKEPVAPCSRMLETALNPLLEEKTRVMETPPEEDWGREWMKVPWSTADHTPTVPTSSEGPGSAVKQSVHL